jgi:hypothetical protein
VTRFLLGRVLVCTLFLLSVCVGRLAHADEPVFRVDSLVSPTPASYLPGMVEFAAKIDNPGAQTLTGEVLLMGSDMGDEVFTSRAPFSVAPGSNALLRLPMVARQVVRAEIQVGPSVAYSAQFNGNFEIAVRVFDANEPSRLKASLEGLSIATNTSPMSRGPGTGNSPRLRFAVPVLDSTSGEPILPTRVASWHGMHLVVLPTSRLESLSNEEAESLAGFVLAGGTLALHVTRPEDLERPRFEALVGGSVKETVIAQSFLEYIPLPSGKGASDPYPLEDNVWPPSDLHFVGYRGENLEPSPFGASAAYGLGEVVLLGFDPTNRAHMADPWVRTRATELARRAFERSAIAAIHPGESVASPSYSRSMMGGVGMSQLIRQTLDPNRTARWGIGLAGLLICAYAVLAGPIAFARAKKKNRPLRALVWLPVLSLLTFLAIVGLGFIAKGGRSVRRLALVEVGAGMQTGVVRSYRGFFSPSAQEIDVGLSARTGMLTLEREETTAFGLVLDGDGLRLTDVEGTPGQTVVVREDALENVGGGVSVTRGPGAQEITITNRTNRNLRGLVVKLPDDSFWFEPKLAAGQSIGSSALGKAPNGFSFWVGHPTTPLGAPAPPVDFYDLQSFFTQGRESELGEAWFAFAMSLPSDAMWFPQGVPVILAELESDGARARDSGVPLKGQRTLLRVVGFGGERP